MADFGDFEKKLGYTFKNKNLLTTALSHSSYINEQGQSKFKSNERLEFLGDAIVDMVVSDYVYHLLPSENEGELTKLRAAVVCESSFAAIAETMGFGRYLLLGKGEESTGGRNRASILADAFEALVAAIYLDGGMEQAEAWILSKLKEPIDSANKGNAAKDYKTLLQERVQKGDRGRVTYQVIDEKGPDHAKVFTVEVAIDGQIAASGTGTSKKDAEQDAAGKAYENLMK